MTLKALVEQLAGTGAVIVVPQDVAPGKSRALGVYTRQVGVAHPISWGSEAEVSSSAVQHFTVNDVDASGAMPERATFSALASSPPRTDGAVSYRASHPAPAAEPAPTCTESSPPLAH